MDEEKVPSIGISLQTQLPNGQVLVLQSFVGRDEDKKTLDAMLDKLRVSAERQLAFGGLREAKAKLVQLEGIAASHATRMEIVDKNIKESWNVNGRKGDVRLSQKQLSDQQQAYQYAEDTKRSIANQKTLIAELEAVTGA